MKRNSYALALTGALYFLGNSQTQIPITISGTLPTSIDNTAESWFPPIVDEDQTMGCGNVTGIGYIFNFEANYSRNSSAKTPNNHFHWIYTYDLLNGGSRDSGTYSMFIRHPE